LEQGGDVQNTQGLNSPYEVYFFSRKPEEYGLGNRYYSYEIDRANEQTLDSAKAKTFNDVQFKMIQFAEPTVDVQGKKYIYVIRSYASREEFESVMSPEHINKGIGIRGLHYSAAERHGDAIGITIEADTPQAAKEQFHAWHASIKEALKALASRFAILNKEAGQKIEELADRRREELNRAKNAL
jgi:hypothetical protein